MKKLMFLSIFSVISMILVAQDFMSKPIDQLTPEEKEKRHQILLYKRTGGFVVKREDNPGMFAFVNAQSKVNQSVFGEDIKEICRICKIDYAIQTRKDKVDPLHAISALKETRANAALFITDLPEMKEPLLIAPESRWGILNVAALAVDNPSKEQFEKRVRREVWRAFSMVAGSPCTEMEHCLLNPVVSLRDLDAFASNTFSPEPLGRMEKQLNKMGIKKYYRCSYKSACKQGWAAAPTNDVQKAIWDAVKNGSTDTSKKGK